MARRDLPALLGGTSQDPDGPPITKLHFTTTEPWGTHAELCRGHSAQSHFFGESSMTQFLEIHDDRGTFRIDMDHIHKFDDGRSDGQVQIETSRSYGGCRTFYITPKKWEEAKKRASNP